MWTFKSPKTAWVFLLCCLFLPSTTVDAQENAQGKRLYLTYCSGCHGSSGKGDGAASKSLPVKPANHTQAKVMNQLTDRYLFQVISEGGAKVGKSPFMPAWGAILKEKQIQDIVSYIRHLSNSAPDRTEGK